MAKKMLIDATHAEETRVVVVDGNKVEEFDFESENKRQIAGNIYLAKVTRVEPSLQAAFVDYGGNRHGFLAFSEIHPDYYQIPVADREALMAEERAYAKAQEEEDEKPVKRTRTRRTRSRGKARSDEQTENKSEATAVSADTVPATTADAATAAPAQKSIGGMDVVELDGADEATHGAVDALSPDFSAQDTSAAVVETPAETPAPAAADVKSDAPKAEAEVSTAVPAEAEPVKSDDVASEETAAAEDTAEDTAKSASDDSAAEDAKSDDDKSGGSTPDVIAQNSNNDDPVISQDAVPADQVAADAAAPEASAEEKTDEASDAATIETVSEGAEATAEEAATEAETVVEAVAEDTAVEVVAETAPEDATAEVAVEAAAEAATDAAAEGSADKSSDVAADDSTDDAANDDDDDDDDDENKPSDAFEKDDSIESVAEEDVREEIRQPRKPRPRRYKIQEVIKVRQILLVQVVKEERGNKGAALTTYLSLAGRYCVLMPNTARGGGISRKITNIADRKKLKEIAAEIDVPDGAGLIIRTAGAARTRSEIKRDYEYLQRMWEQIRTLTLKSTAPAKIYEEGDLIKRSIRDLYNSDIDEVFVEGEAGYRIAKDFMKMIMPSHAKNVKRYSEGLPLFARYQVEAYLGGMFNPTVQLRSGGYIVIDVTEALVAVDVNSGRATKEGSIEETALKTNLEAAEEVARQARLRDLAGLIVIDFIDMEERRNNTAVEKRLKDKLKTDRARIQIGRISGFGLLEMSRQRLRPGMLEATTQPCHHCHGTGLIRSDDNLALNILRQLEEEGTRRRSREVLLTAPLPIINYLINNKRENIASIEARYGMSIRIEADPSLISPNFTIEKFKIATRVVKEVTSAVVSVNSDLMDAIDEEDARAADVAEAADIAAEAARDSRQNQDHPDSQERQDRQDSPVDAAEDTDDAERPKKRRRRRRRRKSGNGEGAEAANVEAQAANDGDSSATGETAAEQPAEAAQAAETAAVSTDAEAAADEVKKPARRRSRKPRGAAAAEAEAGAEAAADVPADAAAETPAEAPAEATAEAEAAPDADKPKKRVTRSRSRAKAKPAADAVEGEAAAADTGEAATAEKPAPKKRAPRKRKPKVAEVVAEPVADTVAEPAAEPVTAPVAETAAEVAADVAVEAAAVTAAGPVSEAATVQAAAEPAPARTEPVAETVAEIAAPAAAPVAAQPAATEEVVKAEPEAAPVAASEDAKDEVAEEAKPKRKGWWSLGR
jgi:ribonuclease E